MVHTFPNIRIGLLVGVRGGVPSRNHDIRLGDIVVSGRDHGKGGIFQYDYGRVAQNQPFQDTSFLNQPPPVLLKAMSALIAHYDIRGCDIHESVQKALQGIHRRRKYQRPPSTSDRLYQSTYTHPLDSSTSCIAACGEDPSNIVARAERDEEDGDSIVHYGMIASSNQLMNDALIRDRAAEEGVLCFEMEAAGLVNHFPCLVIRGISDYSDTHKNEDWQGYAAMAAAAYAKDLLSRIHPNIAEAETRISEQL